VADELGGALTISANGTARVSAAATQYTTALFNGARVTDKFYSLGNMEDDLRCGRDDTY